MKKVLFLLLFLIPVNLFAIEYNRGTYENYEAEHLKCQQTNGWTELEILEGKIGTDIYGNPQPDKCRTLKEFDVIFQNSDESNDYLWRKYTTNELTTLTEQEYLNLKDEWYPEIE